MFWLLFMLQTKHLICDWLWQPPYEYLNKGTYGHPGGLQHATKSGVGTFLCFYIYFMLTVKADVGEIWTASILFGMYEAFIHYHIDWAKIYTNKWYDLKPNNENFFRLIGFDQYLHQLVYLLLAFYCTIKGVA